MHAYMRAFYYILVWSKVIGVSQENIVSIYLGKYEQQMHNWLIEQRYAFFGRKKYKLICRSLSSNTYLWLLTLIDL